MKKTGIKLVSAVLALSILVSCTPQDMESENPVSSVDYASFEFVLHRDDYLSEKKKNKIASCVKKDNYEYQKGQYFGTYNQYDIVLISQIDGEEYRDAQVMKIGECNFFIGDTEKLIAFKDNSYILLSEAYKKGLIKNNDIQNIQYVYGNYYSEFNSERFYAVMKKDANSPNKKYTVEDFPTIQIKEVRRSQWASNELGDEISVVLPIKNRRNVINVIEKVKKLENVLFAELIESIPLD